MPSLVSRWWAVLAGVVLLVVSSPVHAEEPGTAARREEAQQHFERGLELASGERNWQAALEEFLRSRSLYPTRSATRNAAIALGELGRYSEALELYDALLEEFAASLPADQLRAAQFEATKLRQRVGQLELAQAETGTVIAIDGKQRGLAPLARPLWLDPGTYTLRLSREGYAPSEQKIRVVAGTITVVSSGLRSLRGSGVLFVREANDEALDVLVDSIAVGKTPWRGHAAIGRRVVQLRSGWRGTAPANAQVELGEETELVLTARSLEVELVVVPRPELATVFMDGVFLGSGAWRGLLPRGHHRIEVLAPGFKPFRRDMVLRPGTSVVKATLEEQRRADGARDPWLIEAVAGPALSRRIARRGSESAAGASPNGWLVATRLGWQPFEPLMFHVLGGYWRLSSESAGSIALRGDHGRPFVADDYRETLALGSTYFGAGGGLISAGRIPVVARLEAGLARLSLTGEKTGSFSGVALSERSDGGVERLPVSGDLTIVERAHRAWAPFFSTELRLGYRFTPWLSADLGVALTLVSASGHRRDNRYLLFPQDDRSSIAAGALTLEEEEALSPFLLISPSLGVRLQL